MSRFFKSLLVILLSASMVYAAGSWATNGWTYKPQLTTQGTTDYEQFNLSQDKVDAEIQDLHDTNISQGAAITSQGNSITTLQTKAARFATLGDTGYATLAAAITTIGSNNVTLIVPAGAWVASGSVPANISLHFLKGGYFTVATGVTVTINGPVQAGLYQIFSCTGTGKVLFGSAAVDYVYPKWWGAVGDGSADDTAPIQAAINAIGSAGGGECRLLPGNYKITAGLVLGDGNESTYSTYNSVKLIGRWGAALDTGAPAPNVKISPAFASDLWAITVNGMVGWGIVGVDINCSDSHTYGINIVRGIGGHMEQVTFVACQNTSLSCYTSATQNTFDHIYFWLPPGASSARGLLVDGNPAVVDTWYNTFRRMHITFSDSGQTGIMLRYCDNIQFHDVSMNPLGGGGAIGIFIDYTAVTNFPGDIQFTNLDLGNNTVATNGSPTALSAPCYINGFSTGNGAQPPNLNGLRIETDARRDLAKMYLSSAQSIGSSPTVINLDNAEYDNHFLTNTSTHKVTVKVPGYYRLTAQVEVGSYSGASTVWLEIKKNGADTLARALASNNATSVTLNTATVYYLAAGTEITLQCTITGGSTALVTGDLSTFLVVEGP